MTKFPEIFEALTLPFDNSEVKTRPQGGRYVPYITARTAMNRLDKILGPENWWDEYFPNENSVLCKLTIKLPDGQVITKCDAGGYAGMQDQGDDDKSGYSDAFKRACVKFGVGRYLYNNGVTSFQQDQTQESSSDSSSGPLPRPRQQTDPGNFHIPKSGRALFAWAKEMEKHFETVLIPRMNAVAKRMNWQGLMIDWTEEQVDYIALKAILHIKGLPTYKGEFDHIEENIEVKQLRAKIHVAIRALLSQQLERTPEESEIRIAFTHYASLQGGEPTSLSTCSDPERLLTILNAVLAAQTEASKTEDKQ